MKTNQRTSLTKRLMKDALLRMLEKDPIERITVAGLCREAEINRTTFYRHYQIPKQVLDEIAEDEAKEIKRRLLPSDTALHQNIPLLCRYIFEQRRLHTLLYKNFDTQMALDFQRHLEDSCYFRPLPGAQAKSTAGI